jgi:7-cyano-7-deazaguanine synthase in queuosine biosynthesis
MSKLIFFSGGIESTALLNNADPVEDVLVTVLPTFPRGIVTSKLQSAQAIAERFGFTVNYAQIQLPVEPEPYNFVHQLASFVAVAHLWVVKDSSITEIWAGRNSAEVPIVHDPLNFKTQQLAAWNFMHPTIPFIHPLQHLTKIQHWRSIPLDVQPLVNSCIFYNNCGKCYKCQEVQELITQHA